jgi:hypothetical protein
VRGFCLWTAVGLAVAIVILLATASLTGGVGWRSLSAAGLIALVCFLVGMIRVAAVASRVKPELVWRVAAFAGVRYSWRAPDAPSVQTFRELGLVPSFDAAEFEDYSSGERAGCGFELNEADLKRRHKSSKGRDTYRTCFRGQFLCVRAPIRFLGVTVVLRDVSLPPGRELKRVRLVDPRFEEVFEVYSNDQVEARYLLPPDFMERLLAFEALQHGKRAQAAFAGGELLISMRGGDLFEAGSMFKPLVDISRARHVLEEIELVHAIIGSLMAQREPGPLVEPNAPES